MRQIFLAEMLADILGNEEREGEREREIRFHMLASQDALCKCLCKLIFTFSMSQAEYSILMDQTFSIDCEE